MKNTLLILLKHFIFSCCVERRACLVGEVAVAVDLRTRVEFAQVDQQICNGRLLGLGAGVLGCLPVLAAAADVDHADAVGVVSGAMCSGDVDVAPWLYAAIEVDDVVVADVGEAALDVPAAYLGDGALAALGRGGAVDDDLVNDSAALLQAAWDEQGQRGGAYDAVGRDAFLLLELAHGLLMTRRPAPAKAFCIWRTISPRDPFLYVITLCFLRVRCLVARRI